MAASIPRNQGSNLIEQALLPPNRASPYLPAIAVGSVDTQCPSVGWTRTLFVITTKKRAHAAGLQEQEQEQGRSACIRPRHSKARVQVPNQICWSSGRRRVGLDDSNNFSLWLVESKGEVHSPPPPPPLYMSSRLAKILLNYRISPQTTIGTSPAELLLDRRPRTCLDLLRPNAAATHNQGLILYECINTTEPLSHISQ